jgi:hypothetical protein
MYAPTKMPFLSQLHTLHLLNEHTYHYAWTPIIQPADIEHRIFRNFFTTYFHQLFQWTILETGSRGADLK